MGEEDLRKKGEKYEMGQFVDTPDSKTETFITTDDGMLRSFGTGATRDTAEGKLDPEGFTNPLVMKQFYKYMNMNRLQSDGKLRDSDNWQKGIPLDAYMKSLKRHCDEAWLEHRGYKSDAGIRAAMCGIMFNAMGYLQVLFKEGGALQDFDGREPTPEIAERLLKIDFDDQEKYRYESNIEWLNGRDER